MSDEWLAAIDAMEKEMAGAIQCDVTEFRWVPTSKWRPRHRVERPCTEPATHVTTMKAHGRCAASVGYLCDHHLAEQTENLHTTVACATCMVQQPVHAAITWEKL